MCGGRGEDGKHCGGKEVKVVGAAGDDGERGHHEARGNAVPLIRGRIIAVGGGHGRRREDK